MKIIAYHGSQHKNFNYDSEKALYFTTDKKQAESYAKREWDEGLIEGEIPVVFTFELNIQSPLELKDSDQFFDFCDTNMNEWYKYELQEQGYDSVIFISDKGTKLIAVFNENQFKLLDKEVLPKSHKYYYPKEDGIDPNDIDDYYYDEEELNESLLEDVRPQYLYHGTTFESAKEIMWSNTLEGSTDIGNGQYGVSLTRNLSYAKDFADYKADVNGDYGIVIFELDYEKLKHHYKIRPYYDLLDSQRASNSDKLKYNEYEEVVIGDIKPLSQYIKNIYVDEQAQEQIESNDEYIEYFGNAKTFDGVEIIKSHFNKDIDNQIHEVLKLAGVKLDEVK